jgi:hypothetical protein
MAVRDAQPIDALDTPVTASPVGQALLVGYRTQVPLAADEIRLVPVLQRLSAAVTYGRLRAALSPDAVVEPNRAGSPPCVPGSP